MSTTVTQPDGIESMPPTPPRRRWAIWRRPVGLHEFLREYVDRCSVHGARHLCQRNRMPIEGVFWSFAALGGSAAMVWMFADRHIRIPIVVRVDYRYMQWNTTFPSIAICAHEKLYDTAFDRFIHSFLVTSVDTAGGGGRSSLSNRTRTFVHALVNQRLDQPFDVAVHESAIRAESFIRIMYKLTTAPDYRAVAGGDSAAHFGALAAKKHAPRPNGRAIATYRFRMLTDLGTCDTFNSRIAPYLSVEFYVTGQPGGAIGDPSMETNCFDATRRTLAVHCLLDSQIYVHSPFEAPNSKNAVRIDYKLLAAGRTFRFKALGTVAGKHVRNLFVGQRKCRFHDESNLPHFPLTYSHPLCKLECRIQIIRAWCQCVPCSVLGLNCLNWFKDRIERHVANCHCDKSCEEVRHFLDGTTTTAAATVPTAELPTEHQMRQRTKPSDEQTTTTTTTLHIELDSPERRLQLDILYSLDGVMVSVGATLGLFLGIRALSAVEFVYWHVLHLSVCLHQMRRSIPI